MELSKELLDRIVEISQGIASPKPAHGGTEVLLVPDAFHLVAVEDVIGKHRLAPQRKQASLTFTTAESFVAYWNLFNSEQSQLFGSQEQTTVTAIFDYHHAGEGPAQWREHRATFRLLQTEEWKLWLANNGKKKSQADFALFLEDNAADILEPDGAAMLDYAREMQAKTDVTFASSVNLGSGRRQFTYQEQGSTTVGKGKMEVPESFKLRLVTHLGGPLKEVTARLRYRIDEGKLILWYDLLRPHTVNEQAFTWCVETIGTGCGVDVLMGTP